MPESSTPYFFEEAERASTANQPGDRENALKFTLDDLNWLKAVYLPDKAARTAAKNPMQVHELLLDLADKPAIPMAGAFAMSRPANGEAVLYTPWKGLIKFADMDDLKSKLKEWLEQETGKHELLRFLSVAQRTRVLAGSAPGITTQDIDAAVFQRQEHILERNRAANLTAMMAELVEAPSLLWMLDETLKIAFHKPFAALDQRHTRMDTVTTSTTASDDKVTRKKTSSVPLSDALLQLYLHNNHWPSGDSRTFSNPLHGTSSEADNKTWESTLQQIVQSFTPRLQSLIETYWNTSINNGPSRQAFFSQCLRDAYYLDLLLKRQQGVLTAEGYLQLIAVGLESATTSPVRVEKVRVTAPFKHYVELACTLMIGKADSLGYLYSPGRGIEVTSDLSSVRKTVLQMMISDGHEDNLLNFLSLQERNTFIELTPLDDRMIIGEPVTTPVFERLMTGILDRQLSNLTYALNRYRESEGTLDPHALIDKALDVRAMIDQRLLSTDAGGRWSTQTDLRWTAQPATVRAESAKQQLATLATLEQALETRLESHPPVATTARSVDEAAANVDSSLKTLQADFANLFATALKSELQLRTVARTLSAPEQAIIRTVLQTPKKLQRAALNGFLPDAFSLALQTGNSVEPLPLASCFVLTERGGLDREHSGKAILWTPALGFEAFPSLAPLLAELEGRLKDHDKRLTLLENLGRSERLPGRSYTLAPLQRVVDHLFEHVQKPFVQLDRVSVTKALATDTRSAVATRTDLLKLVALREPQTGLRRATDIAQSLITQQNTPPWLAKASIQDQILHAELLEQYLRNVDKDQDYLSGVRSLARTAHHELHKQLKADTFDLDPDKIELQISARGASTAKAQTLTNFALDHLQELDAARFTLVSLDEGKKIPEAMDANYIKTLIRNLKLGQHQQAILDTAFATTNADATERRNRFAAQLPWQLMHFAHTEKLQERLSETGFDLIKQVMDMPDAIARATVEGASAIIRPLELKGIREQQTISVPGVYLVGDKDEATGPQVLLAPYSARHSLREYENEAALITELKTHGALRDWVLNSVPAQVRELCKEKLAATAGQTGGISLASTPVKANLFQRLLKDNLGLISRFLGLQSENNSREQWETVKQVLGEDLDLATSFFTGKLRYPITVWQSFREFKQSAEDLQTHRWSAAIREFISGVGQLASLRQSLEAQQTPASAVSEPDAQDDTETKAEDAKDKIKTPEKRFNYKDIAVTAPGRTQLQRFESTGVDLGSLMLDTSLGLYTDSTDKKNYAPVEGKVYSLEKNGERWRIAGKKPLGPYVRQNVSKQWVLDLEKIPSLGIINRWSSAYSAWEGMNIQAKGMPQIRRLFPVKARLIDEGLDLATSYAWNAFRNLQLLNTSGNTVTPVHRLIMDFLDVPAVLPAHVTALEKVVGDVFAALLDPSLRKPKSKRFAVGRVLADEDHTYAFVVPKDPQRIIYLTERFFHPNFDYYRNYMTDAAFPIRAHSRAATLIHELSHIACQTADIAYLDSGRPFHDLIETSPQRAKNLKKALSDLQRKALSSHTPLNELFAVYNADLGQWEDLGSTTYEDTDEAKERVLKLTGKPSLSEARTRFAAEPLIRMAVQLGNADSVTWLITQLGRQLHVSTP